MANGHHGTPPPDDFVVAAGAPPGQHLGEEVPVRVRAGEVRMEEVRQEPRPRGGVRPVVREAVLDPVQQLDPVGMAPGGVDDHIRVRRRRVPGVGVVGGDQNEGPLWPQHLERELDQVVVDPAVAVGAPSAEEIRSGLTPPLA